MEATGLSAPLNSTVYLRFNSQAPNFSFTVTAQRQTTGDESWRQPHADPSIACNNVRWQMCDGVNRRGRISVSPVQRVGPGESIAAQACVTCSSPGSWAWAAFIDVSHQACLT